MELTAGKVKDAMSEAGAKSADLWMVPIGDLHVLPGFNVRTQDADYKAHIRAIADSIKANGFYKNQPLGVFVRLVDGKNQICVTEGHSRHAAALLAIEEGEPIERLPVVNAPAGTTLEDLTVKLVTSNNGKPLTRLETAAVVKKLAGFGWEQKEIGEKLGMTVATVDALLTLAGAPAAVRKLVANGEVSATNAIKAVKKHGDKASETLSAAISGAATRGKRKATAKDLGAQKTPGKLAKALLKVEADNPGFQWPAGMAAVFEAARG